MTVIADVEAALPDELETARQIWKRVGQWAPNSVRNALEQLVREAKAERRREPTGGGGFIHRYRRPR